MSLVCPVCGAEHPDTERFCAHCDVPLIQEGGPRELVVDEKAERMRKIKPQYAEGELRCVAVGRQQPEAELIQNLLLEEGVPSTLRRSRGFDVPEMLAAGPRDVMVPQSGVATAREVLLQADLIAEHAEAATSPARILAWLLAATGIVAVIAVVIDATS